VENGAGDQVAVVAKDALREAFERHYASLLRLSLLLTGSKEDAEDIVQESFARAANRIGQLEPEDRGRYMRTVVLNTWRTRHRRSRLEARTWLGFHQRREPEEVEERDALWRALQHLPTRQRACLVLRYFEDLPDREIGELLGCSVGTVKSQVSRGLRRLRQVYRGEEHPDEV
jgi:RNA polymerase sigma-70 factor (sigma-E family)